MAATSLSFESLGIDYKPPMDPFNNDIFRGKALNYVGVVLNEFSQKENIEPKLTTYWHQRCELRNEY